MLKIRPNWENCGKLLPNDSVDAMICTFECMFCKGCVNSVLFNVCPNCGGGFEKKPISPMSLLKKYPASEEMFLKQINEKAFEEKLKQYQKIEPQSR